MNIKTTCLSLTPLALFALAGCSSDASADAAGSGEDSSNASPLTGAIVVDGSSTVFPIAQAVAEEFDARHGDVRASVGVSGTGGGFKRFTKGETDISDASRPIKAAEAAAAKEAGIEFIEIPVAYDGLSIVVNPENTWTKQLTIADLQKIFLEDQAAKSWKELDPSYPDVPIKVFMPGTDSGTFDYFREVVAGKDGNIKPHEMSANEDDNVLVRGVAGEKGAIGFFGCAYYFEHEDKVRAVPIVPESGGKAVMPTPATIESGEYEPFSRPLFIYVKKASKDKPQVDAFVRFWFENGPELAKEVGYVPLPEQIYARAKKKYEDGHTGSHYLDANGEKKHGTLVEIYQ